MCPLLRSVELQEPVVAVCTAAGNCASAVEVTVGAGASSLVLLVELAGCFRVLTDFAERAAESFIAALASLRALLAAFLACLYALRASL